MNKTIPCIKNKCLKYPACRFKNKIVCNVLADYVTKSKEKCPFYKRSDIKWWRNFLDNRFPNLNSLYREKIKRH